MLTFTKKCFEKLKNAAKLLLIVACITVIFLSIPFVLMSLLVFLWTAIDPSYYQAIWWVEPLAIIELSLMIFVCFLILVQLDEK